MEVQRFLVGPLNTNCYLVQSKKTKETLLVDPGMACDELKFKIYSIDPWPF